MVVTPLHAKGTQKAINDLWGEAAVPDTKAQAAPIGTSFTSAHPVIATKHEGKTKWTFQNMKSNFLPCC